MHYEIEELSISRKRVHFHVPADQVKEKLEAAFGNLRRHVRVNGFRPGHVPLKILEQRFGKQVRADVASDLIQRYWKDVAPTLNTIGQAAVNQGDLAFDHPFIFSITVDVRPELKVESYTGMEVPYAAVDVPEEAVDRFVQARLESAKRLMDVTEDREVQDGDNILAHVVLKDGDTVVNEAQGAAIQVGGEKHYSGVDALLLGLHRDQERSARVTLGADATIADIAGKDLDATVRVLAIRRVQAPPLSDEVALELGYEGGVLGMRTALQETIRSRNDAVARDNARVWLLRELVRRNAFEPPESLVEEYQELVLMEQKVRHAQAGHDPRTLDVSAEAQKEVRDQARFAAKASLILGAIAHSENLEPTEDEIEAMYERIAQERGQRIEAVKGAFVKEDAVGMLRERIIENKTLDWLLEGAKLVAPPETPPEKAAAEAAPAAEVPVPEKKASAPKTARAKAASPKAARAKAAPAQAAPAETAPVQATPAEAAPAQAAPAETAPAQAAPAEAASPETETPKATPKRARAPAAKKTKVDPT
jgi:trigger factor